ncbi:inositol monophosphatase family protein [Demetria terragena]|uniref:inositol monophosphatase family protein n=1 Tax=Demetria terragena TaxID=63959 RepID=UPI00036E1FBB|nr:inositol monophosphatase [Demetria terragena]
MDSDAVLTMLREVAAEVITPRFRALAEGEVMEKNPGDLVTVADREAEVVITRELQSAYPDATVIGEEATAADPTLLEGLSELDHWFTVDPIDGTKNFVHGSPDHAVMVAEVLHGEVVRSWIWQPEHGQAFVAERGAGAWVDGVRIAHRAPDPMGALAGVTSRRSSEGVVLGDLPPLKLSWVCCGVDYPQLAMGGADFITYTHAMPWDHAPGALLLAETGGVLRHLDGSTYSPYETRGGLLGAASVEIADRVSPLLK